MKLSQLKSARRGGAKKAAEDFERDRKREPSDSLVEIISEYGTPAPEENTKKHRKGPGQDAAKKLREDYRRITRRPMTSEARKDLDDLYYNKSPQI